MNIAYPMLHMVFIINILSLLMSFSLTLSKLLFITVMTLLFLASVLQKKIYVRWTIKGLHANGFFFLLFYALMIGLGLLYGYDKKYVIINLFLLLPLFVFLLIPKNIDPSKIYNIILIYAFVSVFFSYLEVFFWENIPFLKHYVDASVVANEENHMLGSLFRDDTLKAFGIFSNALQNGLFLVFAFIIMGARLLDKFQWRYVLMIGLLLPVLYWTYTRNVQLSFFAAVLLIAVVRGLSKKSLNLAWSLSFFMYLGLVVSAVLYVAQLNSFDGNSIYARVFSWGIIMNEYLLNQLASFHVFLGYALTQFSGDFSPDTPYWAIDNSVLMIYLSSGLLGIILYFSWLIHLSKVLFKKSVELYGREKTNIQILLITVFVYFISGAMNANILNLTFMLPVLLLASVYTRLTKKVKKKEAFCE